MQPINLNKITDQLRSSVASREGWCQLWALGIFYFQPLRPVETKALVISVGVHGDEINPLVLATLLLEDLLAQRPVVPCLLIFAHPDAIHAQQRYLSTNLNRLFALDNKAKLACQEQKRANEIEGALRKFYQLHSSGAYHLDFHSSIRPSVYPSFALVPHSQQQQDAQCLEPWLSGLGVGAIVYTDFVNHTLSYFSARQGAIAITLELGHNLAWQAVDVTKLTPWRDAILTWLQGGQGYQQREQQADLLRFKVGRQIYKTCDDFHLSSLASGPNFTCVREGQVLAFDKGSAVLAPEKQWLLFANDKVEQGARALLCLTAL